jgi:uncharacterized protein YndB with AHSA1/START domain
MNDPDDDPVRMTLPADDEILITRDLAAPRFQVFRAWTTPELVRQWWAGQRGTVTTAEIDLRVGGRWRYVMLAGGGFEVAFHGEFREVVPDERIVSTNVFEGQPVPDEQAPVTTTTFADAPGGTALTLHTRAGTRAIRDEIVQSGMLEGVREQLAELERVAATLT